MGITNFCRLIYPISPPSSEPTPFDSLLVDCQSFLYGAIDHSLETDEVKLFHEICESIWNQLRNLIKWFLSHPCASENVTVILSFDGEGVPMKFATQRDRRSKTKQNASRKSFYRYVLFGHNALTLGVQKFLREQFENFDWTLKIILCGSNVPGEGEHKIFQLAEAEKEPPCRNPVVVSVDQDVFVLAFLRLDRYDSLQIYRYKKFYHVTSLVRALPYPLRRLVDVSFLFGNDFIPVLVGITDDNVATFHRALTFDEDEEEEEDVVTNIARFLRNLGRHVQFTRVEFVDRKLIVCFWITHLWILDYYTQRSFLQQFLENRLYDAFDRHQLLTGLEDAEYSRDAYREAKDVYEHMMTQPVPHAERHVFTDEALLNRLKRYWTEPQNGLCNVLRLTSSNRNRRRLKRRLSTDSETPPKKKARIEKGRKRWPKPPGNGVFDPVERVDERGRARKRVGGRDR